MGRQINFFLHTDDQPDFDLFLQSFGEIVLLPYYYRTNQVVTVPDTQIRDPKKEGNRVYLVRPKDYPDMKLTHIENFGYWLLDDLSLPVLHYDRCVNEVNEIHRGRLYFQPKYVENMQWVEKPEAFVKWADQIIKATRRRLKKHHIDAGSWTYDEYVGEHAAAWIEQNKPQSQKGGSSLKVLDSFDQ